MDEKNKVGQPPLFGSVEELQAKIDAYFEDCARLRTITRWDQKKNMEVTVMRERPRTIEGLADALGTNRQTLLNYQNRDGYFDTIQRAKHRVQMWKVESGWQGDVDPRVLQFDLTNNHGYRNNVHQEVQMNVSDVVLPEPPQEEEE